jgi:hypothetical protein
VFLSGLGLESESLSADRGEVAGSSASYSKGVGLNLSSEISCPQPLHVYYRIILYIDHGLVLLNPLFIKSSLDNLLLLLLLLFVGWD